MLKWVSVGMRGGVKGEKIDKNNKWKGQVESEEWKNERETGKNKNFLLDDEHTEKEYNSIHAHSNDHSIIHSSPYYSSSHMFATYSLIVEFNNQYQPTVQRRSSWCW